jgi:hypothetical protein
MQSLIVYSIRYRSRQHSGDRGYSGSPRGTLWTQPIVAHSPKPSGVQHCESACCSERAVPHTQALLYRKARAARASSQDGASSQERVSLIMCVLIRQQGCKAMCKPFQRTEPASSLIAQLCLRRATHRYGAHLDLAASLHHLV